MKIRSVFGREILDSRGNPTLEVTVCLDDGSSGTASVPSGASTGRYEAHELRDGDAKRFHGKGVLTAVNTVNTTVRSLICNTSASFFETDRILRNADGSETKSSLGANTILAVSSAVAKAAASSLHLPLYRYLGGMVGTRLPVPMMNILNGGAHASNNLDIQEFMIVPLGFSTFADALRAGTEIYHTLGSLLHKKGKSTAVGDEGGFAPDLANEEEAIEFIIDAIVSAGYDTEQVRIALDAASSEWYSDGKYVLPKQENIFTPEELVQKWEHLADRYPILSIEDGVGETDTAGWTLLTRALGERCMLVGDDLFVTNPTRLQDGIRSGIGNAVLVKPNQIGSLSETLDVIRIAHENGYRTILSHRSGDTGDTMISDIAVAVNASFIKTGAPCRFERIAKYNRLLKIEAELGESSVFSSNVQ